MDSNNTTNSQDKPILKAALKYAERGISVFAVLPDSKRPATSNKAWGVRLGRELRKGEGGLNQATTDPDTIRWMFEPRAAARIGMPCGKVNSILVADFDLHKSGEEGRNAAAMWDKYRDEIGQTQTVTTEKGGRHAYFAYEDGHGQRELGEGIEVQGNGQYVVIPPSQGYTYGPRIDKEEWEVPPWEGIPTSSFAGQERKPLSGGDTPEHVLALIKVLNAKGDGWHNATRDIVAHLVGAGWQDAEILRYVIQWTRGGYSHLETFEDVCVMVAGARQKFIKSGEVPKGPKDRAAAFVSAAKKLTPDQLTDARKWMEKFTGECNE